MFASPIARAIGSLLVAAALAGTAHATTLTLDENLDLASPISSSSSYGLYQGTPAFSTKPSLVLDVGDKLDYTVMFNKGQSLSLQNVQYIWGYVGSPTTSTVKETGELELLNADGSVMLTSNLKTYTESSNTFGQAFVSADFAGALPVTTTFAGIRYVGTVDSYSGGIVSRAYDTAGFGYFATTATIIAPPVPEPASVALMLTGLGCLAFARSRRLSRSVPTPSTGR